MFKDKNTLSEMRGLLLKFQIWQDRLQQLKANLDSETDYRDLCQSLNSIKLDIRCEAISAQQKLRQPMSTQQKDIYEGIEDLSMLLRARVDSKPYTKLRENIACVESELSMAIEKLNAFLATEASDTHINDNSGMQAEKAY